MASEEADGLGRKTPFPLIGDQTQRLSRALGVLDESSGTSLHAVVLLDPTGDLVFRQIFDNNTRVGTSNRKLTYLFIYLFIL